MNNKLNTQIFLKVLLLIGIYACASKSPKEPVIIPPTHSDLLIIDQTGDDRIKKLVSASNCVINKKSFQEELKSVDSFTDINKNGKQVLEKILDSKQGIVKFYTQNWIAWKFAQVNGYVDNGSNVININTRQLWRSDKSIVNTIVHELSHVTGYKHQGNSPSGNQNSVPYKIGSIAENNIEGCL